MKQLTFLGPKNLRWLELAEPVLRSPTDAIVRPFVAARCDGDAVFLRPELERQLRLGGLLHVLDADFRRPGTNPFAGPFAYGHEGVAEVLACGEDVRSVRRGDLVVVPWAISCGHCGRCAAGLTTKCATALGDKTLAAFGFSDAVGGYGGMVSDALRVPWADATLVPVPSGVDPVALASASDNVPDAYRTVAPYLARTPGAPVLIVGGGAKSIGLYAVGIAKALGSSRIDYVDSSRTRLGVAERWGANAVPLEKSARWYRDGVPPNRDGYPVTVDASSTTSGLGFALGCLSPGGTCTGVGFYVRRGTPLPLWKMYLKSATLHVGVAHARADLPAVLALIRDKRFDPSVLSPLVADWNDAPEALLERATKVVLRRAPLGLAA